MQALKILSKPCHSYWKKLALAIVGRWDARLNPLWDGGHIKFFRRNIKHAVGRNRIPGYSDFVRRALAESLCEIHDCSGSDADIYVLRHRPLTGLSGRLNPGISK